MKNNDDLTPLDRFSPEDRDLVTALRSADDEARVELLYSLEELDDELAGEILRLLDSDSADDVRGAAAIALGPSLEMCDWELDDDGKFEHDPDGISCAPLSQAVYDRALATLERLHTDTETPTLVRRRALEAAVRSPKEWQLAAIREAWSSADPDWRTTALFCMGYYHPVDFSQEISTAFHSGPEEHQREAILAAGERGLEKLLPEVVAIASNPGGPLELRYAAVEALGHLGGEEELDLLEKLSRSHDETMAEIAEEAREQVNTTLEVAAMEEELDEEEPPE
jgi:HEAT repeat protein